jgi:hypothetical protein
MSTEEIREFQGQYRWLSNFWPAPISYGHDIYPTVEHFYQAMKTTDQTKRKAIITLPHAAAVKKFAKTIQLRDDWEDIKLDVMRLAIAKKFVAGSALADLLLQTGHATLVEGNNWGDTFWGVCKNKGANHLGLIIMAHRQLLLDSQ